MTKKPEFLKLVSVAIMASGLLVGCATDGTSETTTEVVQEAGASAAAKNAIYAAKIKNAHAKRLGYEWRDTSKLIEAAEKAAAKGDNDKAIELANKARDQAIAAIAQAEAEAARYAKDKGASDMDSKMTSEDYTVVSGDNLWNISAKGSVYGNPYQWPLIYKANSNKIKDADLIYSGQVFSIPSATSAEVSAAVQHAKTRGAWTIGESEASDQDYLAK
jgi:nucleoid-associated protein YgaU